MDLGLSGKACIVTGATSGIGLATARMLVDEGAAVLILGRDSDRLRAAMHETGAEEALTLDVTESHAPGDLYGRCKRRWDGRLDVLVNNAGTSAISSLDELTDDDWNAQWELNVMAPMRLMRRLAPLMAESGGGRIVNVTSSSGKRPSLRNAAYSVTKAAQLSLSRVFADEYAGKGVLVNAVAPGPVATELWTGPHGMAAQAAERSGKTREEELAAAAAKIPLGRLGTPEEVAAVIVFLCSEQASNVTGSAWSVDGGAVPFAF